MTRPGAACKQCALAATLAIRQNLYDSNTPFILRSPSRLCLKHIKKQLRVSGDELYMSCCSAAETATGTDLSA
eukprot:CAMPEP_0202900408 /NCGR_PEP_ID=MMETSP1392-20130828/11526_1 /ASSEMBLY_ACC=CAM_ASM_000868 /TAXON_ID=225041 /ORGANISM="Chlamydomonas chlamydogama, Strain SAG 11-48b" /LENGTH=72 /DNA_ID=CAMNT_0049586789 /DNA_START=365 /DNA_END=583 /DNA_ORIENTATION=+